MTRAEMLRTLRRRADCLAHRIADREGGLVWRGLDYDRAELAALRWALEELDPESGVERRGIQ
jgi:hypothetical protein